MFIYLLIIFEEEFTPLLILAIFSCKGAGFLLCKKKVRAATPSKTKIQGIIIAIIPPVDNPPFFFDSIKIGE
jgi:hypothetical protein